MVGAQNITSRILDSLYAHPLGAPSGSFAAVPPAAGAAVAAIPFSFEDGGEAGVVDATAAIVAVAVAVVAAAPAAVGRSLTRSTVRLARSTSARRRRSSKRKCSSLCLSSSAHNSASDNSCACTWGGTQRQCFEFCCRVFQGRCDASSLLEIMKLWTAYIHTAETFSCRQFRTQLVS